MAIAVDATSSGKDTTTNTLTVAHTCTGSDLVLVVLAGAYDGAGSDRDISGITYDGTALTYIDRGEYDAEDSQMEAWYIADPSTGNNNIIVTYGGTCDEVTLMAISLTGAGTIDTNDNASGDGVTITKTLDCAADAMMIGGTQTTTASPTNLSVTVGTLIAEVDPGFTASSAYIVSADGNTTLTWTGGDGAWAVVVVSINIKVASTDNPAFLLNMMR